jgi:hypothetical protein
MNEITRIGPPRDRRVSRRFLTARNFRRGLLVAVIVFIAVSVYSELRSPERGGHGRLYERRNLSTVDAAREAPEAIVESPIAEAAAPDPLLIDPQHRKEWLGVDGSEDLPTAVPAPAASDVVGRIETAPDAEPILGWNPAGREQKSEVVIAGGAQGVRVVRH